MVEGWWRPRPPLLLQAQPVQSGWGFPDLPSRTPELEDSSPLSSEELRLPGHTRVDSLGWGEVGKAVSLGK